MVELSIMQKSTASLANEGERQNFQRLGYVSAAGNEFCVGEGTTLIEKDIRPPHFLCLKAQKDWE